MAVKSDRASRYRGLRLKASGLIDNLAQRGVWLDGNISLLGEHAVITYKYSIISLVSILLLICFFAGTAVIYTKTRGSGSGKAGK